MDLQSVPGANCFYVSKWLMIFFFVDDIVVLTHKQHADKRHEFEKALFARFEMKALRELTWFLDIRIIRNRNQKKIWLCQNSYIEKMATKFNLLNSKNFAAPLTETPQPFEGESNRQQMYAYQQKVGSLNFAAVTTRPDIVFAVSKLFQYFQNPGPANLRAADHVIAYLYSTKFLVIEFSESYHSNIFSCASDAAYADDISIRRSSMEFLFHLYGESIDWKAFKQPTVTTSSTEAELLAITDTAKQSIWWRRFFKSIEFDTEETLRIECDNIQTLRILTKETMKFEIKLRHVDIHRHWLRQEVQAGRIHTKWVPTAEMAADGLTKVLPRQKHEEFIRQLRLVDITSIISLALNGKTGGVC